MPFNKTRAVFQIIAGLLVAGGAGAQSYDISVLAGIPQLRVGDAPTSAHQFYAMSVTWDSGGRFYFSSGSQVFRVSKAGVIDMVIGNGASGRSGDGGPATSANVSGR